MIRLAAILFVLLPTPAWAVIALAPGIPAPPFGLDDVLPAEPAEWPGAVNASWAYVDNSVACTDTSNPNGRPGNPRCTIPAVTISHTGIRYIILGDGHINTGSAINRTCACEAANLCWISSRTLRVVNSAKFGQPQAAPSGQRATIRNSEFILKGRPGYCILQGLFFDGSTLGKRLLRVNGHSGAAPSYLTVRYNRFLCNGLADNGAMIAMSGITAGADAEYNIAYGNIGENCGAAEGPTENDMHFIKAGNDANHLWIGNNSGVDLGGDTIQMGTASIADTERVTQIYIWHNYGCCNFEDVFDIKEAVDVIMSQNWMDSPNGACTVVHNGPDWVWWMFNTCVNHNGNGFISTLSTNTYAIGNLIYNVHAGVGEGVIQSRGSTSVTAVNNTIVDVDTGFLSQTGTNPLYGANNVVVDSASGYWHLYLESSSDFDMTDSLFYQTGGTAKLRYGTGTTYTVSGFQAAFPGECIECLEANPNFVNAAGRDYRLNAGSPAIDSGVEHATYATYQTRYGLDIRKDIVGTTRPQGAGWDMGAYEYLSATGNNASDTLAPSEAVGLAVTLVINETISLGEDMGTGQSTIATRTAPNRRQPVTGGYMRR